MAVLASVSAISWGAIGQWFAVLVLVLIAWRVTRGGAGSAVSELSKANEVLTQRVHDLGAEVRDLRVENATLKERTDVALALVPAVREIVSTITASIEAHEARGLAALEQHERRAERRGTAGLNVLKLIADRLGPEPNGATA